MRQASTVRIALQAWIFEIGSGFLLVDRHDPEHLDAALCENLGITRLRVQDALRRGECGVLFRDLAGGKQPVVFALKGVKRVLHRSKALMSQGACWSVSGFAGPRRGHAYGAYWCAAL